jgi:hypothetical protein
MRVIDNSVLCLLCHLTRLATRIFLVNSNSGTFEQGGGYLGCALVGFHMTVSGFDFTGQVRRPRPKLLSQSGLYAVMAVFAVAIGIVLAFAT